MKEQKTGGEKVEKGSEERRSDGQTEQTLRSFEKFKGDKERGIKM